VSIAAKEHNVPVYVAAESYKFARLFPLSQRDMPLERKQLDFGPLLPASVGIDNPSRDYTPPQVGPCACGFWIGGRVQLP
jgi:translation initiation factor eIF-2B subunit alpha